MTNLTEAVNLIGDLSVFKNTYYGTIANILEIIGDDAPITSSL